MSDKKYVCCEFCKNDFDYCDDTFRVRVYSRAHVKRLVFNICRACAEKSLLVRYIAIIDEG